MDVTAAGLTGSATPARAADTFNYHVVRQFAVMTVVWGIVGMAVGVLLAAQLNSISIRRGCRSDGCARCIPMR